MLLTAIQLDLTYTVFRCTVDDSVTRHDGSRASARLEKNKRTSNRSPLIFFTCEEFSSAVSIAFGYGYGEIFFMNMHSLIALLLQTLSAFALDVQPPKFEIRPVSELKMVEMLRNPKTSKIDAVKIAFGSGGCRKEDNKVSYQLSIADVKSVETPQELRSISVGRHVDALIKITVLERLQAGTTCPMAYDITDTVNLETLVRDHARELGLNIDEPNTSFHFRFMFATPVAAITTIANFPKR